MSDPGTRAADAAQKALELLFRGIYRQARRRILRLLKSFSSQLQKKWKDKKRQYDRGEITRHDYDGFLYSAFHNATWRENSVNIAQALYEANVRANALIEARKKIVFATNADYETESIRKATDEKIKGEYGLPAVDRLLREHPELLPRRQVNGVKDKAWNQRQIADAVAQSIISGENIDQLAKRIADKTSSANMEAMKRYARTAMTAAQNAGRIEAMHNAQAMGINVQKKWLSVMDKRTRDAHRELNGQIADVDEPFYVYLGKGKDGHIQYPGDPEADPSNVYNCRCTLTFYYPDYQKRGK